MSIRKIIMLHKGEFTDCIDRLTLRFKDGSLEERNAAVKEEQVRGMSPLKIFMIGAVLLQVFIMIPATFINSDMAKFWYIFTDIIIASLALTIEFIIHRSGKLKMLRGFISTTGGLFAAVHYNSRDSPSPGIYLGAIAVLLLLLLSCSTFATSWITATLAQLCGQIAVSITVFVIFYGRFVGAYLAATLLTFNIGLLFGPLIYREMERTQKNLIFLGWQIDEELKNWKKLIETLPVGIFIVRDGEVVYSNKSARALLKMIMPVESNEDITVNSGLKIELKKVVKQGEETIDLYNLLFNQNQPLPKEVLNEKFYYRPIDTLPTLLSVSVNKLFLGSESSDVVVLQDLSIYEQLDEEKAYRQYQRLFFAMITHELRNPLQGILGVLELLKSTQTSEDSAKQCSIGLNTGKLMLCLIQDILDLSQIEANKFTLNDEFFSPDSAITECLEVMEFQYKKKGLELCKHISCDSDLQIKNDKTRYKQIVFNLLGNALKFTQAGHVDITLSYQSESQTLVTSVSDTGIGIKAEDQASLFNAYGKMEAHRRVNPHGVGFGLNICKRLSETMGGGIAFKSEYGKGTEFTFTVKDKMRPSGIIIDIGSTTNVIPKRTCDKKGKVVVVDDEYICGYVLQNMIKSFGYNAELAQSGEEAVRMVGDKGKNEIKVMFVDINMPGLNGFETAKEVLKLYEKGEAPRVIGVTGDDSQSLQEKAKESGMVHITTKPLDKDRLLKILYDFF